MQAMSSVLSKSSVTVQICSRSGTWSQLMPWRSVILWSTDSPGERWSTAGPPWAESNERNRPGGLPAGTGMCGTLQVLGEQVKRSWMAGCSGTQVSTAEGHGHPQSASKSTGSRLSFPKSLYFLIDKISEIKLGDWRRVVNVFHK